MKLLLSSLVLASLFGPVAARAQVGVRIDIGLPAAPPLVVVQPGVKVVEGFNEEVFFTNGWYWCRRGDAWYRARTPRSQFVWVEPRRVPVALVRIPEGRYRNWHHERAERAEHRRAERRDEHREGHEHR